MHFMKLDDMERFQDVFREWTIDLRVIYNLKFAKMKYRNSKNTSFSGKSSKIAGSARQNHLHRRPVGVLCGTLWFHSILWQMKQ